MEKILIVAVVCLSLAAAASAQALHVVHLHILKERTGAKGPVSSKVFKDAQLPDLTRWV
jgi:hypothetical protein